MESPPSKSALPPDRSRFAVLLFTDIVGSTDLKARHGVPAYSEALRIHNGHFERLAHDCLNLRTLQSRGDGYFAEAGSVADAVRFALLFEQAMREGPWGEVRLAVRMGIHAGEVGALNAEDGTWIVGPAADLASRVADLALGGQILLTRFPFDEARHFIREHPPVAGKTMPPLRWLAHGPYLMKGREEPMEIFEVGADGLAPLVAPPDSEKAKRAIRPGEEETLGWRPAVGLEIPGRTGWHLTERLGAGGFGEVWIGEHAKLHQRRAFKFCFDDERLRALKREVTLVRLLRSALGERDDIVHIHELKLDAPPFYLESDLAPHGNLLQWAERQGGLDKIPLAQRIALVAHTATALAAAHSIGVLHKDIKPTNILIFDGPDGEPRPRLVDFGIGTLADPAVLGEFGVTAAGFTRTKVEHSTGTPTYSPPEYLAGKPYTIQGDIYGLGVLLYQLVTVQPLAPLAHGWERDIADPLLREDIAACVDGDPARRLPSAADLAERLLTLESRRAASVESERIAREASARAEAEAAALAARASAIRFRKIAITFAVLALLAVAGGLLAWLNQRKADTALNEVAHRNAEIDRKNKEYRVMLDTAALSYRFVAEEELRAGHAQAAFAYLAMACDYEPQSTLAAEKAVAALNKWSLPPPLAIFDTRAKQLRGAQFSPDGSQLLITSGDWGVQLWDVRGEKLLATLADDAVSVQSGAFSPDGSRLVTVSVDGRVWVWNVASGKRLAVFSANSDPERSPTFSPDGSQILTASGDRGAQLWDAVSGKRLAAYSESAGLVGSAGFSPDRSRIVTGSDDKTARLWEAASGKLLATLPDHASAVQASVFSPDGSRIIVAGGDEGRVWDAASGELLRRLPSKSSIGSAAFSADGSRIIIGSVGLYAEVWDAISGVRALASADHRGPVTGAQFNPDCSRFVTVSSDFTARVRELPGGRELATLSGHDAAVKSAQFSPDGSLIATASDDGTVRLWDGTTSLPVIFTGHDGIVTSAQFSPDGARIVTASDDKTVRVWDATTGRVLASLTGHTGSVTNAQFSPDGSRIVTASNDGTAGVWDLSSGKMLASLASPTNTPPSDTATAPNRIRIPATSENKGSSKPLAPLPQKEPAAESRRRIRVISSDGAGVSPLPAPNRSEDHLSPDPSSGSGVRALPTPTQTEAPPKPGGGLYPKVRPRVRAIPPPPAGAMNSGQFSPDGSRIVTASEDKTARVWDAASGKLLTTLTGHTASVTSAQFSPDGARIVTASQDATARVWDAASGKPQTLLTGHKRAVTTAQFSPDGLRIVTASGDDTARVWETASGKVLTTLTGHAGPVRSAQFNSDGSRIVTASYDDTVVVWDANRGERLATFQDKTMRLQSASFSPDGTRIVTADGKTASVWTILSSHAGPVPAWFSDLLRYVSQYRLNSKGELAMLSADEWLALRERLREVRRASAGQDTPYLRFLRRFVPE